MCDKFLDAVPQVPHNRDGKVKKLQFEWRRSVEMAPKFGQISNANFFQKIVNYDVIKGFWDLISQKLMKSY